MNIDERLEFLVQSTESLHQTTMEHSRQLATLMTVSNRHEQRWNRLQRAMQAAFEEWFNEDGEERENNGK